MSVAVQYEGLSQEQGAHSDIKLTHSNTVRLMEMCERSETHKQPSKPTDDSAQIHF